MLNATVFIDSFGLGLQQYSVGARIEMTDGVMQITDGIGFNAPFDTKAHRLMRLVREAAAAQVLTRLGLTIDPDDIVVCGSFD